MIAALKRVVEPFLRSSGFSGSFPHYRRAGAQSIDLLDIQFNRRGGSFVIEVARCPVDGIITPWGSHIPPEKTEARHIHPDYRPRIQPSNAADKWFCFDANSVAKVAAEVLSRLANDDVWHKLPLGRAKRANPNGSISD